MSTRTRRASALVVIVVAVALLAAAVARWGWSARDVHRDAVEVPVMWVERTDDGGLAGGVSAVGVKVEHSGSAASLAVNLNDSTTGSTGTSWNASSASAAAVAMLYSGQDPRGVEITFRVDDAIDGSSAGGALTVGVLAALRGDDLRPGVTMTGTVSPDGSIGSVDGVEAKVRGAAAAGYTQVMVPESSTTAASSAEASAAESSAAESSSAESSTETSAESQVDVVSLSREPGIEVWAVSTVGEAYNGFTGHLVAAPAGPAPTIRPDFLQRIEAQVASVQAALEDSIALAAAEGSVTAEQESTARAQLAASRQQSDAAEPADAYATAVAALVVVNQLTASASAAEVIEDRGSADAAADQIALAKEQAGRAEEALASASSKAATTSPVQQIAAVAALTWLAKAVAVLRTISSELAASGGSVDSQVLEAAEVNAQYGVVVERIFPDSFALAQLLQPSPEAEPTAMAAFMGAYSDLLSSAGSANQRYYEEVLTSISRSPELTFSQPGHLYGAVQQLQELSSAGARTGSGAVPATDSTSATASATTTASAPPPENVAAANYLARSAWDFAYYTSSAYLVSAEQAYGLTGTGIGSLSVTASDAGALASALMSGTTTVDAYSTQLAGYGIDPDHGLWAARSGDAMARVGTGTRHEVASAATGLQLVWDGAIEVFMGNAANRSLAGQG